LFLANSAFALIFAPWPNQPQPDNIPPPPGPVVPGGGGGGPIDVGGGNPPVVNNPGPGPNAPEPATIIGGLIGAATLGVAGLWRRRKSAQAKPD